MPGSDNQRAIGAERRFTTDREAADLKLKFSGIHVERLDRGRSRRRQKTSPVGTETNRSVIEVIGPHRTGPVPSDEVRGQAAIGDVQQSFIRTKLQVIQDTRIVMHSLQGSWIVAIQDSNRSCTRTCGDPPPAGAYGNRKDAVVGFMRPGSEPESN